MVTLGSKWFYYVVKYYVFYYAVKLRSKSSMVLTLEDEFSHWVMSSNFVQKYPM